MVEKWGLVSGEEEMMSYTYWRMVLDGVRDEEEEGREGRREGVWYWSQRIRRMRLYFLGFHRMGICVFGSGRELEGPTRKTRM